MPTSPRSFIIAAPLCVVFLTSACGKSDEPARPSTNAVRAEAAAAGSQAQADGTGLPIDAKTALDYGNAAYREKRFDDALVSYRAAAAVAPDHAAPWFGLYMVAGAMKNAALADSAMARVKAISENPAALSDHANAAAAPSSAGALPPGHPSTRALPPGHPSTPTLPPAHPSLKR